MRRSLRFPTIEIVYHVAVVSLLGGFLFLLWTNLRRLRRLEDVPAKNEPEAPHISVLIPARNEVETLPRCIDSLLAQDYSHFDVTVLDDGSDDGTRELIERYSDADTRVRLLVGEPLPEGWAGKPWACHQLSHHARGDILLFIDADVWFEPDTLARTAAIMQDESPALLSVMGHLETVSLSERVIVPGLYTAFLCGAPLWLVEDPRYPDIAAASGQFMCFPRDAYNAIGGHEAIGDQIIEDIAFASIVKRSGYRLTARTAFDTVHCRMYRSWREAFDGFSKNAFGALGERPAVAAGVGSIILATQVLPVPLAAYGVWRRNRGVLGFWLPAFEVGLTILLRVLLSRATRFRVGDAPLFPVTAVAYLAIVARSVWWKYRPGGYEWKGRSYSQASLPR